MFSIKKDSDKHLCSISIKSTIHVDSWVSQKLKAAQYDAHQYPQWTFGRMVLRAIAGDGLYEESGMIKFVSSLFIDHNSSDSLGLV